MSYFVKDNVQIDNYETPRSQWLGKTKNTSQKWEEGERKDFNENGRLRVILDAVPERPTGE